MHTMAMKAPRVIYQQRGAALLAMMAVLIVVVTSAFLARMSLNSQRITQGKENSKVMSEAKQALLAYTIRQTPPGTMICPDFDGDGLADLVGSNCQVQRGFLPYRDLALKDYSDANGNILWYAVDTNYIDSNAVTLNPSLGANLVLDNSGAYIAFIFTPGTIVANQVRRTADDAGDVRQYLEGENADANPARYSTLSSDSNNDRILGISQQEFWHIVEKRVLVSVASVIDAYFNTAGCSEYPWAANNASPGDSAAANEFGYVPFGVTIPYGGAAGCAASLGAPAWMPTHWSDVLRFGFCGPSGADCITLSGDMNATRNALLLSAGPLLSGQARPSANLNDYFENDNADSDMQFDILETRNFNNGFNDVLYPFGP